MSHRSLSLLFLLALGAFGLVAPAPVDATVVLWSDVETLAENADLILVGELIANDSAERAASFGIYTDYTFQVTSVLSGDVGETVIVRLPGGEDAGRSVVVAGVPSFEYGETYLLVLHGIQPQAYGESGDTPYYVPLGLSQGVWTLESYGSEIEAVQRHTDVVFLDGAGQVVNVAPVETTPLSTLGARLAQGAQR